MPDLHRRIPAVLLPLFVLSLAGCAGGGSGPQNNQSANVSVRSSAATVTQGQAVALEAYVNPSLANGKVTFYNGSTPLGTAALNSYGASPVAIALLATTFNSPGPQTITAQYSGNNFYSAKTSQAITIVVDSTHLAPSSVSLQASSTTPQYQTNLTLSADVSPSSATGTVTFYNNQTVIGSAPVNAGSASLTTSFAAGGVATLHAVYSGDYQDLSSTSNSVTLTIAGPLATTTSLTASSGSAAIGSPVTLTATLAPATTTGSVTFYNGATALGTANVNAGIATHTSSFSTSGNLTLKAVFAANSSWETSTSALVPLLIYGNTPDTVSLQGVPSSVISSEPLTLQATVSPSAATGTVTLYQGSTSIATSQLSRGAASFVNVRLNAGLQTLTVVYGGDPTYTSSTSSPVTINVTAPGSTPATTTLTLSEYSGFGGDAVTLTAKIAPSTATGQVFFYDSGSLLATVVLSSGTAAWSQSFPDGYHVLTAVYSGDPTYASNTSTQQNLTLSDPQPPPTPTPLPCPTDPTLCSILCAGDPTCPPTFPTPQAEQKQRITSASRPQPVSF